MIILQINTFVFAIALALFNRIPVEKMRTYGASRQEEKDFHFYNAAIAFLYITDLTYVGSKSAIPFFINLALCFTIFWMMFDIVLNTITDKTAFYVGNTAWTDRQLRKLGKHAGQIKAAGCLVVIVALNVLYYCL